MSLSLVKESFFAAPVTSITCDKLFSAAMSLSYEKRAALPSSLDTLFSSDNINEGRDHVRHLVSTANCIPL